MNGLHIVAEFHDCQCAAALLLRVEELAHVCLTACQAGGLTVVAQTFHQFGALDTPSGATGALVLAESHLAVHTWPEWRGATLDLYVCNVSRDNREQAETVFKKLQQDFAPNRATVRRIERDNPAAAPKNLANGS